MLHPSGEANDTIPVEYLSLKSLRMKKASVFRIPQKVFAGRFLLSVQKWH